MGKKDWAGELAIVDLAFPRAFQRCHDLYMWGREIVKLYSRLSKKYDSLHEVYSPTRWGLLPSCDALAHNNLVSLQNSVLCDA